MVLVTRQAPDFTAAAVLGNGEIVEKFNFKQHTNGKATVLFFWPMDFTFVCPSELIAFDKRYEEFQKRGVEVVGVSFDSEFVHNAWRNTPVDRAVLARLNTRWLPTSNVKFRKLTASSIRTKALRCAVPS